MDSKNQDEPLSLPNAANADDDDCLENAEPSTSAAMKSFRTALRAYNLNESITVRPSKKFKLSANENDSEREKIVVPAAMQMANAKPTADKQKELKAHDKLPAKEQLQPATATNKSSDQQDQKNENIDELSMSTLNEYFTSISFNLFDHNWSKALHNLPNIDNLDEYEFLPQPENVEFRCLYGIEKIVDFVKAEKVGKETPIVKMPKMCSLCNIDFSPSWHLTEKSTNAEQVVCFDCYNDPSRFQLRGTLLMRLLVLLLKQIKTEQDGTQALDVQQQQELQKQQELLKQMQQAREQQQSNQMRAASNSYWIGVQALSELGVFGNSLINLWDNNTNLNNLVNAVGVNTATFAPLTENQLIEQIMNVQAQLLERFALSNYNVSLMQMNSAYPLFMAYNSLMAQASIMKVNAARLLTPATLQLADLQRHMLLQALQSPDMQRMVEDLVANALFCSQYNNNSYANFG